MKVILTAEQVELLKLGNVWIKNEPHKEYYYLPYWFEHNLDTDEWFMYHLGKPLPDELAKEIKEMREFTMKELFPERKKYPQSSEKKPLRLILANGEEMLFVEGFEFEMKQGFSDGTVKSIDDYEKAKWIKRTYTNGDRPYIERMIEGRNAKNGLLGLRNIKKE